MGFLATFILLLLHCLEILFIMAKINFKLELDSSCCYLYSVGWNFVRFFIAMIVLKLLLLFMLQVRCHSQNTTAKTGKWNHYSSVVHILRCKGCLFSRQVTSLSQKTSWVFVFASSFSFSRIKYVIHSAAIFDRKNKCSEDEDKCVSRDKIIHDL